MEKFWRIKDWNEHFENNRTRDLKRMAWVPMPNKMDGDGYTELLDHPNGAAHFGVWVAIVEIASRCGLSPVDYDAAGRCGKTAGECEGHAGARIRRGTLVRDNGKPHDFNSIFRLSRMPIEILKEVIPRLISLGWLEEIPLSSILESDSYNKPQEGAGKSQELANVPHEGEFLTRARGTERNGTERNGIERNRNTPPTPSVDSSPSWMLDETFTQFSELAKKFWPRILPVEIAEGHRWFWTKLSIEERLKATHNLRLRIDAGEDGEYVKHMPDYLKNEWRRGPKHSNGKPANGNGNSNGNGHPPKYEPPPGLVTSEVFEKLQREREERARS
jgi:hypothetical protein